LFVARAGLMNQGTSARPERLISVNMALASKGKVKAGPLAKALKKRTGALTISFEFDKAESSTLTDIELELLSMQLRKMKVASLWTPELDSLALIANEQKGAKGDFPGPCPVIFNGGSDDVEAAVAAGATAVVVAASELEVGEAATKSGVEVIWNVQSAKEVEELVEAGVGMAFLIGEEDSESIRAAVPKDALAVLAVDAMQASQAEVAKCRELVASDCKTLLVKQALVGDEEDMQYSRFILDTLTNKASNAFRITGMTGAANGHFGTGDFGKKVEDVIEWKRIGGAGLGPDVAATAAVVGKSNMRAWAAK